MMSEVGEAETPPHSTTYIKPCIIHPGKPMKCGHIRIMIEGIRWLAHRYVAYKAWGPCPSGKEVCHSCNTPACVELTHLRYDTRKSNLTDRKLGDNKIKKLRQSDADEIRKLLSLGISGKECARRFGVAAQTISKIKKGQTWATPLPQRLL